ncbi:hypothetical protein AAY473_023134 [Plecturocebus cupreus]
MNEPGGYMLSGISQSQKDKDGMIPHTCWSLALLPTWEYSVVISAHCNLCLLGSSDSSTSASRECVQWCTIMAYSSLDLPGSIDPLTSACQVAGTAETDFRHVSQAGLNLLGSRDQPTWASQHAGITGLGHHWEIPGRGATRIASATLLASAAVLPASWRGASQCGVYGTGCPFSQARLVPCPQGEQQLKALRTESFTASTAKPRKT